MDWLSAASVTYRAAHEKLAASSRSGAVQRRPLLLARAKGPAQTRSLREGSGVDERS